uniref:Uncharacterized protein n=1 Tax=Vitis vinifera TaxID=29760 RepID=F6HTQ7_VITVI
MPSHTAVSFSFHSGQSIQALQLGFHQSSFLRFTTGHLIGNVGRAHPLGQHVEFAGKVLALPCPVPAGTLAEVSGSSQLPGLLKLSVPDHGTSNTK